MHGDRAWMMPLSGDRHLGHGPSAVEASHHGLDRFLREHGVEMNLVMHFDNIQMIKEAVALGSGVSLLPGRSLKAELDQGRLVAVTLAAPGLFRPVRIIHRRRRKFSRAVAAFLELLQGGPGAAVS